MQTRKKDSYAIKSKRKLFIILFLISCLFVLGLIYALREDPRIFNKIIYIIGLIFFGFGFIFMGVSSIFSTPTLEINKEGFIEYLTLDVLIPWKYVDNIYLKKFKEKGCKELLDGIAVEINSDDIESFLNCIDSDDRLIAKKRIKDGQPPILIDISDANKKPEYILDLMIDFFCDSIKRDNAASTTPE